MFGWIKSLKSTMSSLRKLDNLSAQASRHVEALAAELLARAEEAEQEIVDAEWEVLPAVRINPQPVALPAPAEVTPAAKRGPGRPKKSAVAQPAAKPARRKAKAKR